MKKDKLIDRSTIERTLRDVIKICDDQGVAPRRKSLPRLILETILRVARTLAPQPKLRRRGLLAAIHEDRATVSLFGVQHALAARVHNLEAAKGLGQWSRHDVKGAIASAVSLRCLRTYASDLGATPKGWQRGRLVVRSLQDKPIPSRVPALILDGTWAITRHNADGRWCLSHVPNGLDVLGGGFKSRSTLIDLAHRINNMRIMRPESGAPSDEECGPPATLGALDKLQHLVTMSFGGIEGYREFLDKHRDD